MRYDTGVGGHGVRMFHLFDLHMRNIEGPQADRARLEATFHRRALGNFREDNQTEIRKDSVPFDLVVFTGDLGDWGRRCR